MKVFKVLLGFLLGLVVLGMFIEFGLQDEMDVDTPGASTGSQ